MAGWRYLAERLTGDGAGEIFDVELDLEVDSIDEALSAPPTMGAKVTTHDRRLVDPDGHPLLEPWSTAIYAEADGEIRAGMLYKGSRFNGSNWTMDLAGFSSYPVGMPYDGSVYYIDVDPLDIFRHMWEHLQAQPNGNLGVVVDQLASPVRVGEEIEQVEFVTGDGEQVSFEAGPRKLNWWQTHNLGREIDSYAKETPFDWLETHAWGDGDTIEHRIKLGYPQLGTRRHDLTGLVLETNLLTEPGVTVGEYVDQVWSLGAGEGRDRIRGHAGVTSTRLRRVKTVEDKSNRSKRAANSHAAEALSGTRGDLVVESLDIVDHSNAPIWGINLGDEIQVYAETDWALVDQWVRVVGRSTNPTQSDSATLTVVRSVNL